MIGLDYCIRLFPSGQPYNMNILNLLSISPAYALAFLVSIVIAVTVHEFAHAWTADMLGDDTPALEGRVTLNPLAHLDPLGSILFLIAGFGWGKPVIYNPMRLKRKSDELLIALAGPASNLILATIFTAATTLLKSGQSSSGILELAATLNVLLASFNLIPIPPLDGSSIIAYFWPEYRSLVGGQVGSIILLVIIFLPLPGGVNVLGLIMQPIIFFFTNLTHLFGLL